MTRWLYSLLMWLAQPLLRHKLARRGRAEPDYLLAVDERFGHYSQTASPDDRLIWLHAVSLGETRAAAGLVAALRARLPHMRLLLTHGTATGRAEGAKLLRPGDVQVWLPWDSSDATQRFLAHFQPRLGILLETEIWPNLVHACARRSVPLVLANARLSAKSLRQAQRLAWLARPAYQALSAVWAQTADDARRLRQLGAPVRAVLGNVKFDSQPNQQQFEQGRAWRANLAKPVVMLASSRDGEEAALLEILHKHLSRAAPSQLGSVNAPGSAALKLGEDCVQWLIVPRHPQRFAEVAQAIEASGVSVSRRSQWHAEGPPNSGATVWLGDSLGEMALYYGLAKVALLGGSFAPLGGQNLIEAAACGCPLLLGPHSFNFAQAAKQALDSGAALPADDLAQAVKSARALAFDDARYLAASQHCQTFSQAHRGATERLVAVLLPYLT